MAIVSDLRYAVRLLGRQRGSALLIIATLALGIGATSAMFTIVYGVLLRPLPYEAPDRIVRLLWPKAPGQGGTGASPADYLDFKHEAANFDAVAGYAQQAMDISTGTGYPERAAGLQVTGQFFQVFGVTPIRGRTFDESPRTASQETAIVLSYGFWQRRFGGSDDAIGKTLRVNGHAHPIVGVMPAGFVWPDANTSLWMLAPQVVPDCPIDYAGDLLTQRDLHYFDTIGRLRSGEALGSAQSHADSVLKRVREQTAVATTPATAQMRAIELVPLKEALVGTSRPALLVLLGAVALVLLIACANVANLLLARATERHREMAVRTALGAPRGRLVRQLLVESLVMALIGGALGLLVAEWGVTALLALAPKDIPRLAEVRVDWSVVAFTTTVCLATGLLFGLAPALQTTSVAPQDVLRDATARTTGAGGAHLTRAALVIAQVAMALMLVATAALMITSFARLQAVDPGFKTEQVLAVGLSLPPARYPETARQHQFYQQVLERLQATPIAVSSSIVFPMPLRAATAQAVFDLDGRTTGPGEQRPTTAIASIGPGYFRTLSVPLLQGRDITAQDTDKAPPVAIVNATFASRYWPNENPVGKRLQFGNEGDAPVTIVGLVADVRGNGLDREAPPTLYFPYQQFTVPYSSLVLRSSASPGDVATALRAIVRQIDPELPVDEVKTLEASVGEAVAQPRFRTMLLTMFAGVALGLALVGVYGVIGYTVAQRRREIGVRAALGATPMDLLALVMKQGLLLAAIGVIAGLIGTYALAGLLKGLLYGVGATDPVTLGAATLALLIVAAAASAIPARRAMRQDPLAALRDS